MSAIEYKLDLGCDGAKSQAKECDIKDIDEILEEHNYIGVHEFINVMGGCKPYADVDLEVESEDEFKERHYKVLANAEKIMKRLFPGGRVVLFDSSGLNSKGKYKISGHFVVNQVGFYRSSQLLKPLFEPYKDSGFDIAVYNKNHTLRMPFCKKPGDTRELKRALFDHENKQMIIIESNNLNNIDKFNDTRKPEDWEDWLITYRGDAKLIEKIEQASKQTIRFKRENIKKEPDDEELKLRRAFTGERKYPKMAFEHIQFIINNVNEERAIDYEEWTRGVWALAHYAEEYDIDEDEMHEIAQEFAARAHNYNEGSTSKLFYKQSTRDKQYTMGTLVYWLKQDNPEAYKSLFAKKEVKPPKVEDETDITYYSDVPQLLASKPDECTVKNWMLRCLKLDCGDNRAQWFGRCKDGWREINNKQNFPFSDKTTKADIIIGQEELKGGKVKDIKKSFEDILLDLKNTPEFTDACRVNEARFWPYFQKTEDDPKKLNTFDGWPFAIETIEEDDDIKFLNNHIGLLFGEAADYVKKWLASCIQKPRHKMPMIVCYSRMEGVGKDLLRQLITEIMGSKYIKALTGTKEILGDFNGSCEETLITFINEGKDEGHSIYDKEAFKSRITDIDMSINKKFKEAKQGQNWSKYIGFTNNKNAFPIAANDRRFATCESSVEMVDNTEYFIKLAALVEDVKVQENYFKYLTSLDISRFNDKDIPKTKMREELKMRDLKDGIKHIIAICNEERPLLRITEESVFGITRLYEDFQNFTKEIGVKNAFIPKRAGYSDQIKLLDCFYNDGQTHRVNNETKRGYLFDKNEIEKSLRKFLKEPTLKLENCRDL